MMLMALAATPQVLERSGLGAPSLLNELGIKCEVPLEGVGENYQGAADHGIHSRLSAASSRPQLHHNALSSS